MANYEIVVTDVTCYGSTLFCVAGWEPGANRMIRPEPPGASTASEASRFWDARFAGPGRAFAVGNVVRVEAAPAPANFPFPHATEDRIVMDERPMPVVRALNLAETAAAVRAGVSPTLDAAFDNALLTPRSGKAYVAPGERTRSLGALEIRSDGFEFYVNTYKPGRPQLRARLTSGGNRYDLPVTAHAARTRWLTDGIAALQGDVEASNRLHLRVGLSRPFPAMPDQCYVQINGVYFL